AVQLRRHNVGTIHAGRSRGWKEIGQRVARAAGGLRRLGIGAGDRVAILALNSDLYIEALYAIAWTGAVSVPLNTRWAVAENAYAVDGSMPKILLADKAYAEIATALRAAKSLTALVYMDEGRPPEGMLGYNELLN